MTNRVQAALAGKDRSPREKIIEAAARLIYRQGWNATGINQILTEAQTPKGSFYYHFQAKEDLGVAIVQFQARHLQQLYARTLLDPGLTGRRSIEAFLGEQIVFHRDGEWRWGCPIGNLSNEIAAGGEEKITAACREALLSFNGALTSAIARGQKDGSVLATESAEMLGVLVSSLWQGALLFMKTYRTGQPLLEAEKCIGEKLFKGSVADPA